MKRGFTMIEMMIVVTLTAMIVGVVASLFAFTSYRLSDSFTQSLVIDQATTVANDIEKTVRNATNCTVRDAGATLVCTMPKTGIDSDGDGYDDTFYPDKTNNKGIEVYSNGDQCWYFNSDANGLYGTGAGMVWKADSTGPGSPAQADNNHAFMRHRGGALRNPLVRSVTFDVNVPSKTVTFTVLSAARMGSTSADTSDTKNSRTISITRSVVWRH